MTLDESRAIVRRMAIPYKGTVVTEDYVDVWHRTALRDLDRAVGEHLADELVGRSQYMPRPAEMNDLRKALYPTLKLLPEVESHPASPDVVASELAKMRALLRKG